MMGTVVLPGASEMGALAVAEASGEPLTVSVASGWVVTGVRVMELVA